jgi:hypothetical protein
MTGALRHAMGVPLCMLLLGNPIITAAPSGSTRAVPIVDCYAGTGCLKPPCASEGLLIVVGGYNLTFCNTTAWTLRTLSNEGRVVLSDTGFTQTVSNVNIVPNTGAVIWPPVHTISLKASLWPVLLALLRASGR